MQKGLSNRTWLLILGALLALSLVAATAVFFLSPSGTTAVITLNGTEVERVDLSQVRETYTRRFTGESGITDVVEIAPGRIRVREADCPDQVCVRQGWIENSVAPIVCLPNRLVIEIQGETDSPADAQVQ